jgi:hypothetical protein
MTPTIAAHLERPQFNSKNTSKYSVITMIQNNTSRVYMPGQIFGHLFCDVICVIIYALMVAQYCLTGYMLIMHHT